MCGGVGQKKVRSASRALGWYMGGRGRVLTADTSHLNYGYQRKCLNYSRGIIIRYTRRTSHSDIVLSSPHSSHSARKGLSGGGGCDMSNESPRSKGFCR